MSALDEKVKRLNTYKKTFLIKEIEEILLAAFNERFFKVDSVKIRHGFYDCKDYKLTGPIEFIESDIINTFARFHAVVYNDYDSSRIPVFCEINKRVNKITLNYTEIVDLFKSYFGDRFNYIEFFDSHKEYTDFSTDPWKRSCIAFDFKLTKCEVTFNELS